MNVNFCENAGWRDDFKFLYELCLAYRYHKSSKLWPLIEWKKLPPMHKARWNSKAIYSIIGFFLLPYQRASLAKACNFICYDWVDAWFRDQHYFEPTYKILLTSLKKIRCKEAINSLKRNWSQEPSRIDIPRSNQVAERAVKIMEDIYRKSLKKKYMNAKFLNKNVI